MAAFLRHNLARLALAVFFVFAVYSNARLIIRNHEIGSRLDSAKQKTAELETQKKKLELLIDYYKTATYKELEARRRLGLRKTNEKVLLVKGLPKEPSSGSIVSDQIYHDAAPVREKPESSLSKWWKYFFGS